MSQFSKSFESDESCSIVTRSSNWKAHSSKPCPDGLWPLVNPSEGQTASMMSLTNKLEEGCSKMLKRHSGMKNMENQLILLNDKSQPRTFFVYFLHFQSKTNLHCMLLFQLYEKLIFKKCGSKNLCTVGIQTRDHWYQWYQQMVHMIIPFQQLVHMIIPIVGTYDNTN